MATSQPLAAQAGLQMLYKGGNAVDAAIAAAVTLTVVEPMSNGVGGDAFAIIWDNERLHGLNGSGRSPKQLTLERLKHYGKMPFRGWDTVTVPGAVSAWAALSNRFGHLPFKDLFEPAIKYARAGFLVSPITAQAWSEMQAEFACFPELITTFFPNGRAPKPGELFQLEDLAKTLELIADTEGEAFYRGALAEKIVAYAAETGGLITEEDLADHTADWCGTILQACGNAELHEIPPNGQGLTALLAVGILEQHSIHDYPIDSADSLHLQIEAMKLAFADAYRFIADPLSMGVQVHDLVSPSYLKERSRLIDMKIAMDSRHGTPPHGGTVYLATADSNGMMVSLIQSTYDGFGSGIVVPGTGISLQNRGACFTLEEGHPNQAAGTKRPFHTIIPGFLTNQGKPLMSFGVMGGSMQPQGHLQMMVRLLSYHQNPQAVADAPRWRVAQKKKVSFESGYSSSVLEELRDRGHELEVLPSRHSPRFGGAQLIYRTDSGYVAASDPRKDGQAVGY